MFIRSVHLHEREAAASIATRRAVGLFVNGAPEHLAKLSGENYLSDAMKPFPNKIDSLQAFEKLFDEVDYVLTDCDGVLFLHNTVIPGANEFMNNIRKLGKKVVFATNNSTKSRRIIIEKLHKLGFEASLDEVMVTGYAAGLYLKKLGFNQRVYVFGSTGIEEEFKLLGIDHTGLGPDPLPHDVADFDRIELDPKIEAVVLGFDYHISYPKLIRGCSYGKRVKPELFIATNLDETLPTTHSHLCIPGTGAVVSIISTAVGRQPIALGKPSSFFFDCIKEVKPDIRPERCLMIGDRLNSDIEFANRNQLRSSLFVESGVSSLDDVRSSIVGGQDQLVPTHYCKDLGELNQFLNALLQAKEGKQA